MIEIIDCCSDSNIDLDGTDFSYYYERSFFSESNFPFTKVMQLSTLTDFRKFLFEQKENVSRHRIASNYFSYMKNLNSYYTNIVAT